MLHWFATTLRSYPEIAVFLSLAVGYYFGGFSYRGSRPRRGHRDADCRRRNRPDRYHDLTDVKSIFFLIFLFAVGYGVGPSLCAASPRMVCRKRSSPSWFVFSVWPCRSSLRKLAGYDVGYAAGLYAGSQTISASMGLATDAINRLAFHLTRPKRCWTRCRSPTPSPTSLAPLARRFCLPRFGPKLLGIDLVAACKAYEARQGGTAEMGGAGSAWHRWELRAFRVADEGGRAVDSVRRPRLW